MTTRTKRSAKSSRIEALVGDARALPPVGPSPLGRNPRGLARGSSLREHGGPERTEERTTDRRLTDHSLSHESASAQLDVHNPSQLDSSALARMSDRGFDDLIQSLRPEQRQCFDAPIHATYIGYYSDPSVLARIACQI